MADVLSWIITLLGPEAVQAILDGATIDASQRTEGEDPTVIKDDQEREKEVWVTAGWVLVEMHVTDWAAAQKEDPQLDAVLQWLEAKKKSDLRTILRDHVSSEEGEIIWRNHQNLSPPKHPLPALHVKRGEWGSVTLHGAKDAPDCCLEGVSSKCRTSRLWPYTIPIARTFLVAQNDQTDETSY